MFTLFVNIQEELQLLILNGAFDIEKYLYHN